MVKNKVAQRAIAAGLAGMMSFSAMAPAALAVDWYPTAAFKELGWLADVDDDEGLDYWTRIWGDTRYDTAKKIVDRTYRNVAAGLYSGIYTPGSYGVAPVAVIASGDNFPDALAANGLAGTLNNGDGAPVFLTKANKLSSQTKDLLRRMQVNTLYVMGGEAAISADVEKEIKDMGIGTIRVAGADRQGTSLAAAKLIDGNWWDRHGINSIIVATGSNYADALSISPYAYQTGSPVLLTKADGTLTDEQVEFINKNDDFSKVVILGGTSAVSDTVIGQLGTYDKHGKFNYDFTRIAGADRYETSAKIARWEVSSDCIGLFDWDWLFVATGENFPDALAGGQLAGGAYNIAHQGDEHYWGSPILLTKEGDGRAEGVIAEALSGNWWSGWGKYGNNSSVFTQLPNLASYGSNWYGDLVNPGFFLDMIVADNLWTSSANLNQIIAGGRFDWNSVYGMTGVEDILFHGFILGGREAVSKKKAEALDDVVDDNIWKNFDDVFDGDWLGTYKDIWLGNDMMSTVYGYDTDDDDYNLMSYNGQVLDVCLRNVGRPVNEPTATTDAVDFEIWTFNLVGDARLGYRTTGYWSNTGAILRVHFDNTRVDPIYPQIIGTF